jgi:cation:H+ antiporter
MVWIEFCACAAIVVVTSTFLMRYADMLAEKTGLGRAWVGGILLAGVTSLPELVSGVTAVSWLGAPNLASGSILGSCLLAVAVLVGPGLNGVGALGFSAVSVAIVLVYGLGARLIARFEQRRLAEVLEKGAQIRHYDAVSTARAYAVFILCALVVVAAGVWLATIGDRLAASTGLSRSFVGNFFLALSTSLPEVASSLAAVRLGAIDLAISNALGSNLFNILLLAVMDAADGPANFWGTLTSANAFAAVIAIMMTGVAIISLTYRASPRTPNRLSWDGWTLAAMYVGAMAALYLLG